MSPIGIYRRLWMEPFIFDKITKFLSYFPGIQVAGPFLCCDDNIISLGKQVFVQTVKLPDVPLEPISLHSLPCSFAGGYPKSPFAQAVFHKNDGKVRGMISFSQPI